MVHWCDDVKPYLVKGDIQFGNVLIRSDVKINATTLWPLSGKQAHGGAHNDTICTVERKVGYGRTAQGDLNV
jgi:hypothetical protein